MCRVVDHRSERPRNRLAGPQPLWRVHSIGDDALHCLVVAVDDAERDVGCGKQIARRDAHALQQAIGVALGRQLQPDVDQRPQPRVGGLQVPGLLRELVGDQAKVLAIELRVERSHIRPDPCLRIAGEDAAHDFQDLPRLRGFRQDVGDAARERQRPRFALAVVRGREHHGDPARLRIETNLFEELEAVHDRHEHVGNHQVGLLGADGREPFAAIRRFEHLVPVITQQRHQEGPVGRDVVDDQNARHVPTCLRGTLCIRRRVTRRPSA